ncbi:MAG: radical SAM protein [Anaerolineae bacterium]|nr:radical SAM protein [Anaerolineae bacterium]
MTARHILNLASDRLHTLPLIILYLTDGCNSRCVMCDIWRSPRRNMALPLVETIASEFRALHGKWVLLSGGEAMQHPHWPQIAQRFRDEGAHVMLLTNGLLLHKQAQAVIEHIDEAIVSLDAGTAPTYAAIRGVDAFDLVLDGIRAVRAGGVPVTTRTTVQRANYAELPEIITAARGVDVNRISFLTVDVSNPFAFGPRFTPDESLPLVAHAGPGAPPEHGPPAAALTAADIDHLGTILDDLEARFADDFASARMAESPDKLRRMLPYFKAVIDQGDFEPPRCNAPHTSTVIEVDGTLRPCYFLPTYGQLNQSTLHAAINTPEARSLRQAYRTGQRPECARCVCPLYKGPRALLRL